MTVWKNTSTLAADAIAMATDILAGKKPSTSSTYNNGIKDIPAKQTAVTVLTKDNLNIYSK